MAEAQAPKVTASDAKVETKTEPKGKADPFAVHLVDLSDPEKIVEHQLDALKAEAAKRDDTDGPADNVSGDASESFGDHVTSTDPFKKAFPPGPDDITKL